MTVRARIEQWERSHLHPRAAKSVESRGRSEKESECDIRTAFQRDRDRILHSKSFRRLKHKTQVFLAPLGDHYRTRLTHTLEVAQIARTISRALNLNEDLTEAIAMGHDLGHTPFGHAGEEVLNRLSAKGFHHARQSVRVVEYLEREGRGLNLTFEVIDGIKKHSKGLGAILAPDNDRPVTLEAEVVRIADVIAYVNHDIDDAIRAGLIKPFDLPEDCLRFFGESHGQRIDTMVKDVINQTVKLDYERVAMSEEGLFLLHKLRKFLYERVYQAPQVKREFAKAYALLERLFAYFVEHPDRIGNWCIESDPVERRVLDYLSGMTDRYAIELYRELFLPKPWRAEVEYGV